MGYDAYEPVCRQRLERTDHLVELVAVKRAEALVYEHRIKAYAAFPVLNYSVIFCTRNNDIIPSLSHFRGAYSYTSRRK